MSIPFFFFPTTGSFDFYVCHVLFFFLNCLLHLFHLCALHFLHYSYFLQEEFNFISTHIMSVFLLLPKIVSFDFYACKFSYFLP